MPAPWLSILIPVYNVAPWLEACLESVLQQAGADIEIIALDDASSDNSAAVLANYHPRVQCLQHTHNRGLSAARNTLRQAAKGDYLWFLDSDDLLLPGAIAQLHQLVTQHAPDLLLCDYRQFYDGDEPQQGEYMLGFCGKPEQLQENKSALFEGIYRSRRLHIWSKISRRQLWDDTLQFPEGRLMEDMTLTPRLALRANSFYYTSQAWVGYRKRAGSILHSLTAKRIDDMSQANAGVLAEWLAAYPQLHPRARFAFCYFCIRSYYYLRHDLRQLYPQQTVDLTLYRSRLLSHIHLSKNRLLLEYIKRGWLLRMLRFVVRY